VTRVRIAVPAADDLRTIRAYIARDSEAAAGAVAHRIRESIAHLRRHPELGRVGRVMGTRELVVAGLPYLVVYRLNDSTVEVLRVLHDAQEWPSS
jgi:addiction module RelE/StbE family toxin